MTENYYEMLLFKIIQQIIKITDFYYRDLISKKPLYRHKKILIIGQGEYFITSLGNQGQYVQTGQIAYYR